MKRSQSCFVVTIYPIPQEQCVAMLWFWLSGQTLPRHTHPKDGTTPKKSVTQYNNKIRFWIITIWTNRSQTCFQIIKTNILFSWHLLYVYGQSAGPARERRVCTLTSISYAHVCGYGRNSMCTGWAAFIGTNGLPCLNFPSVVAFSNTFMHNK